MSAIKYQTAPVPQAVGLKAGFLPRLVQRRARIVSISPSADDHAALRRVIDHTQWRIVTAGTCREAFKILDRANTLLIFCESSLRDGTWKEILAHIADKPEPPLLVVTSRIADNYLWAEVLNLGGYDVLAKPFAENEIRQVLASVWARHTAPLPHPLAVAVPARSL